MLTQKQLSHRFTLEEYLNSSLTDSEKIYELENGQLTEMPPESWQNSKIAMYLLMEIANVISFERISLKTEIITSGNRVNARIPDLVVLSPEGVNEIEQYQRATITLDMPPPVLVVEVVSPGKVNRDRDYRYKRCSEVLGVSPQEAELPSVARRDFEPCSCSDCIKKRSEYAARGIEHYWIVDPQERKFVRLQLEDGLYEIETYEINHEDICLTKPFKLNLKLSQVL